MAAHQGVFIASPEYNASITPLLKNTIDWISLVRERGEPPLAVFKNRVFALGGASHRPLRRACSSLMALRQVLALGCGALVIPEQVTVFRTPSEAFDEMDNLKEERAAASLKRVVAAARRRRTGDGVMDPRERLIVALDLPSVAAAEAMVRGSATRCRSTRSAISSPSPAAWALPKRSIRAGKQVFLDLKLHDIGNTVAKGVESVARLGATFLTVHAYPQTMHAAVDARKGSGLRILAVTVLTSYDDADLAAAGYDFTVPELVAERAAQARDIGIDGLVCSAEEAAKLRAIASGGMVLVTPGIRPAGAEKGDQKRIMTPAAAIAAGADHLVVGRPILEAPDPKAAAEAIVAEIAGAVR